MKRIAIFASGTGSNFVAIHDAIIRHELMCQIGVLVCDQPNALVIQRAKERNIAIFSFSPKVYATKEAYENEILQELKAKNIDLIVLAGYMRLIGQTLLSHYPKKIINIHPSLLPLYRGKDAIGQAIADKAQVIGVTIHYVDEGMDTGEIITSESMMIDPFDSRSEIEVKIHAIEHRLYPKTIQKLLEVIS